MFYFMRRNKYSTVNNYDQLYSVHLILLSTLLFFRRRKDMISTEEERVSYADTPKERGVV
jgi:hypothetical protein